MVLLSRLRHLIHATVPKMTAKQFVNEQYTFKLGATIIFGLPSFIGTYLSQMVLVTLRNNETRKDILITFRHGIALNISLLIKNVHIVSKKRFGRVLF